MLGPGGHKAKVLRRWWVLLLLGLAPGGCSVDVGKLRATAGKDAAGPSEVWTAPVDVPEDTGRTDGLLTPADRVPEASLGAVDSAAGDSSAPDFPQSYEVGYADAADDVPEGVLPETGSEPPDAPIGVGGTGGTIDVPLETGGTGGSSDASTGTGGVSGTGGLPSTGGLDGGGLVDGTSATGGMVGTGGTTSNGGASGIDAPRDTRPPNAIVEYQIPFADSQPWVLTVGPDGNLWIAEHSSGKILKFTMADRNFTAFQAAPADTTIEGIALGADNALWFTERSANKIGRMTTSGSVAEYVVAADSYVLAIVAGPDGKLWFSEMFGNAIGSITTAGIVSEYPQQYGQPVRLAFGPDGKLWFSSYSSNRISYLWPATPNAVTSYSIGDTARGPAGIAVGADGAAWFYETTGNNIGRMTSAGAVAEYPIPTPNSSGGSRAALVTGPDGNLWFTELAANQIGRATLTGAITEFPIPTADSAPYGIVAGPDGKLWFAESNGSRIASIEP